MNSVYKPLDALSDRIVYVRPVPVSDLPDDMQSQADGLKEIYAVHDANGARLALVRDEALAFFLAKENDLALVYVH